VLFASGCSEFTFEIQYQGLGFSQLIPIPAFKAAPCGFVQPFGGDRQLFFKVLSGHGFSKIIASNRSM
jgi:hypothetical protein